MWMHVRENVQHTLACSDYVSATQGHRFLLRTEIFMVENRMIYLENPTSLLLTY